MLRVLFKSTLYLCCYFICAFHTLITLLLFLLDPPAVVPLPLSFYHPSRCYGVGGPSVLLAAFRLPRRYIAPIALPREAVDVLCRPAVKAMHRVAGDILENYKSFAQRGDTWESMEVWQDTLKAIHNLKDGAVEVHTFLETACMLF